MKLFQVLQILDGEVVPQRCKIHLATWNGTDDPLDVYLEGRFDEWQCRQRQKNFERPLVVSLIALGRDDTWLFAGVHNSGACERLEEENMYLYQLGRRAGPNELDGRLIVRFVRPGRQSYLLADNWSDSIDVAEIRPEKLGIADFPGYHSAMLTKQHLDVVVKQAIDSWRVALSNVAGVYVIGDRRTGKLYVGSATAEEGIWTRWCAYSSTAHGGNTELMALLQNEGPGYAQNFQFGVLEADTRATREDVLGREAYWKNLLLTRAPHGYNSN